ncbi:biotin-dependent carboxyltransferase family protein [Fictibacillus sp. Mic-4]|uniref:5-oxoprolinase subunit C family protein n=1 Tax=Fictibacillus sp. Mic-4 TaxID=3132826 RepID=UPI003CF75F4E
MSIEILQSGLSTTIQDSGRTGYQKHGVVVGGAMDPFALRMGNLLVGNEEGAAVIEATLIGPKLLFHEDHLIAISGGDLSPKINGKPVLSWRPVWVKAGSVLAFGHAKKGCRAYVAIAGGIDVPIVMGSRSTYVRAKLGGLEGRALKTGDRLPIGKTSVDCFSLDKKGDAPFSTANWSIGENAIPSYDNRSVRTIGGPEFKDFTEESRTRFFEDEFQIAPQSDRMGYRLSGPDLQLKKPKEQVSEAVSAGTIQVPPGGSPIILLADRQTTGGYPKIGYVATIDLPILAQKKPGDTLRFQNTTVKEAHYALLLRERAINQLKCSIELMKTGGFKRV